MFTVFVTVFVVPVCVLRIIYILWYYTLGADWDDVRSYWWNIGQGWGWRGNRGTYKSGESNADFQNYYFGSSCSSSSTSLMMAMFELFSCCCGLGEFVLGAWRNWCRHCFTGWSSRVPVGFVWIFFLCLVRNVNTKFIPGVVTLNSCLQLQKDELQEKRPKFKMLHGK